MAGLKFNMIYECPPVSLLPAAADASERVSPYRNFKLGVKGYVICKVNQGNAAPVTFTLLQAQDVSGTGAKAVSAMPVWLNNNVAASDAYVAQTPATSFTTDASLEAKIVVFEVLPEAVFDTTNRFLTLAVETSASNAADVTDAMLHIATSEPGQCIITTYQ